MNINVMKNIMGLAAASLISLPLNGSASELVKNGTFENANHWRCWSKAPEGTSFSAYSGGMATVSIEDAGTASWHVMLSQNGIAIEAGKTYYVSFDAYLTNVTQKDINVKIQENGGDWTTYKREICSIGAYFPKHYTFSFTATESDLNARLVFELGEGVPKGIYIDNVSMVDEEDLSLIRNGDFSDYQFDFYHDYKDPYNWSTVMNDDYGEFFVNDYDQGVFNILEASPWVAIAQPNLAIKGGTTYVLQFDMQSIGGSKDIYIKLKEAGGDYSTYYTSFCRISTTAKTYTFRLKPSVTDDNAKLVFQCGQNTNDLIIDNVLMYAE